MRRKVALVDSNSVRDYIERLSSRLAAQLPETGPRYEIAVMFKSTGPMNEPTSFPGGYMFVPVALFTAAENEGEFAGMLAHAMAHAAERHHTGVATRGQVANLSSIPLIFMGGWSGYHSGDPVLVPIGYRSFMRDFELAADRLAVSAMSRAGYDPINLINYVSRVQPARATQFERMHPLLPLETRLSNLRNAIDQLPRQSYPTGAEFSLVQGEVRRMAPPRVRQAPSLRRKNER
jgi:predicted Zn-dependent protease